MKKINFIFYSLIYIILLIVPARAQTYAYPLQISENNRYLTDQNGTPFFWSGDAAWSLIAQLSNEDAVYYLEDRKAKGFTIVMVNLIEHAFSTNPPKNYYGNAPFTGKTFTTPNEAYFQHADYVIDEAAKRGIVVLLFPLYLGYQCGDQGWCQEVNNASQADMQSWGEYVGGRYKGYDNIIWSIGGDTSPSPVKSKVLACVNGILSQDSIHLFTAHNQPESYAVSPWSGESWLTINNVYTYTNTLYQQCKTAYSNSPVKPFFMIESAYENEHGSTGQQLRSQAYWPVLSGGMGYFFGNCPIWHFGSSSNWCGLTNWKNQLSATGSTSMMYVQKLFVSRAWHLLVPDFDHSVLTSGYGSWGNSNYVTAALTDNKNTMIAYLPSSRPVTVDMGSFSGTQATCWWYDPSDGNTVEIGTFTTSGSRNFTPPSSGDWILVIDDAALGFEAPGTQNYYATLTPHVPNLKYPEDNSNIVTSSIGLIWHRTLYAMKYEFQLASDSEFSNLVSTDTNVTDTTINVSNLSIDTEYFWRVRASNNTGTGEWSDTWKFSRISQVPDIVRLESPPDMAQVSADSVVFRWYTGKPQIERYWFEIATDSDFADLYMDTTIADTFKTYANLTNDSGYWWRVRARNQEGWGEFSQTFRFAVMLSDVYEIQQIAGGIKIYANYPNPFNNTTRFNYYLPLAANVRLGIFNTLGQEVRNLIDTRQTSGEKNVDWDGRDSKGYSVSSGIYFYVFSIDQHEFSGKLVFLK